MTTPLSPEDQKREDARLRLAAYSAHISDAIKDIEGMSGENTLANLNVKLRDGNTAAYCWFGIWGFLIAIFLFSGKYWALSAAFFIALTFVPFGVGICMQFNRVLKSCKRAFVFYKIQDVWENHRDVLEFYKVLPKDNPNNSTYKSIEDIKVHDNW
jgi:hypothetical protein